ncbi:hypothetical protein [Luteimonas kalidii]|uniref:Uncharacterized protein n=1 Tax=Luteimonas kalidii TaxID=3042025 RepID=A0ABT6JW22_9GAMM|nr:hypothetical protein [Luteimonas kalidii]MDH5834896.1 hypothetical protein [Luteimonas kalidii]
MLHIVRLIERRHPRHAGRLVALLATLSACGALAGAALLSTRH